MKKRVISLVTMLALCLALLPVAARAVQLPVGTGTVQDPYQISDAAEFQAFAALVNGGQVSICGRLTADIELNGSEESQWTPIGSKDAPYRGVFDGQGHTVSGLYVAGTDYQGLFGNNAGTIKNVTVSGQVGSWSRIGGISGGNSGLIETCVNRCRVTLENPYAYYCGGICGYNTGVIRSCVNEGTVSSGGGGSGGSYIGSGGVCGRNMGGSIENCCNTGTVVSTNGLETSGGVCGSNSGGTVASCFNTGAVTGSGTLAGVCGQAYGGTITNCYYDSEKCAAGDRSGGAVGKPTADFTSGAVAALLQAGDPSSPWGQVAGEDGLPVLLPLQTEEKLVEMGVYTVTFQAWGAVYDKRFVNTSGGTVMLPTAPVSADGASFVMWADQRDGAAFTASTLVTENVTLYAYWKEPTPAVSIDFTAERLTGFAPDGAYTIDGTAVTPEGGALSANAFIGRTVSIVKTGRDDTYFDSAAQSLTVPARPAAPVLTLALAKTADSITVTSAHPGCEFSLDGANWVEDGAFTGLTPGRAYTLQARTKASASAFCSAAMTQVVTTVAADGSASVKPGETVTVSGTEVAYGDAAVTVEKGGTVVAIAPPCGGVVDVRADGTVSAPDWATVKLPDTVTPLPADAAVWGQDGTETWYIVNGEVNLSQLVTVKGDVHLILADGCQLTTTNGINVADDDFDPANGSPNRLTIYAQSMGDEMGALTASVSSGSTSPQPQAAIGGGQGQDAGVITINGGRIRADAYDYVENSTYNHGGAGIGGGGASNGVGGGCGTITVNGGVIATRGGCGAGIGGGYHGAGGVVVINGGTVTAESGGSGIGTGWLGDACDRIEINGGVVNAIGDSGIDARNGTVSISGGEVMASGRVGPGIGGDDSSITISGGTVQATNTMSNAGIGGNCCKVTVSGGTVTAVGSSGSAGVGGNAESITITGGEVTATGGSGAAGIGGGRGGNGERITISGGIVTATGGDGAAGIGGGAVMYYPADETMPERPAGALGGSGGNITITGGTVTATGGAGSTPDETGSYQKPGSGIGDGGSYVYKGTEHAAAQPGSFATGGSGNALIVAAGGDEAVPAISDTSKKGNWHGIVVENKEGQVYGDVTLAGDVTLPADAAVTIPAGTTLIVPAGSTLTVPAGATLTNDGVIAGAVSGTVGGSGQILASPPANAPSRPSAPVTPQRFTDVPSGVWYADAVRFVADNGLFCGTSAATFSPDSDMTRGMLATVLWRLRGAKVVNYAMQYDDVEGGAWYAEAIRWATSERMAAGYADGRFGPEDPVTREQLAVMLWRCDGCPESAGTLDGFADGEQADAWALDALRWAVERRLLTGRSGGSLDPLGCATRAEVAAVLMRYCQTQN